ncbi:MAG: hypothetical protein HQL90_12980 [Magnetococcales bacterium]|nr:hypothetical protein [Magnetococcales bacterium]
MTQDEPIMSGEHKQVPETTGRGSHAPVDGAYPIFLKPRLRLFLSVDLVGSTALKQGKMGERQEGRTLDVNELKHGSRWRDPFLKFYHDFQNKFALEWRKAERELIQYLGTDNNFSKPEFWKAAGDELIYNQLISHSYQACWSVRAWISTADFFRKNLRRTFPALDVKMTAWVAGFPVINSEVVLKKTTDDFFQETQDDRPDLMVALMQQLKNYYNTDNPRDVLDYIGPSMDIGFRLCSLSTPREMPISLELAYILSKVRRDLIARKNRLEYSSGPEGKADPLAAPSLRYMGRKSLKGVLDGRSYPVFWLDVAEKDPVEAAEDAIIVRKEITPDQCLTLFKAFVEEINDPLLMWEPYIEPSLHNSDNEVIDPCIDYRPVQFGQPIREDLKKSEPSYLDAQIDGRGLDHRFVHRTDDPGRLDAHPSGKIQEISDPSDWSGRNGPNDDQGHGRGRLPGNHDQVLNSRRHPEHKRLLDYWLCELKEMETIRSVREKSDQATDASNCKGTEGLENLSIVLSAGD